MKELCLAWFRFQYPNIARLLISATTENYPGVADLILLYSNGFYPYLCFRFDTEERNTILGTKEWQHSIESVGGRYLVVSNFDEAPDTLIGLGRIRVGLGTPLTY